MGNCNFISLQNLILNEIILNKIFFAAICYFPIVLRGTFPLTVTSSSWSNGCCFTTTVLVGRLQYPETRVNNCTENTTVLLSLVSTYGSYAGSAFITCTQHGWFPPPPILEFPLSKNYFLVFLYLKYLML